MAELNCTGCGDRIDYWQDVGYDGPKDMNNTKCNPHTDWATLCMACAEKGGYHDDTSAFARI